MSGIGSADLLNAWEQGLNQPPLQRALILLAVAHPGQTPEALMQLSIGQRDRLLLRLREQLFGSRLQNTAQCPQCDERLEWVSQTSDFTAGPDGDDSATNRFAVHHADTALHFRLPNSLDMAAIATADDPEHILQNLLTRCLLEDDTPAAESPHFPQDVVDAFSEQIEQLDPLADIRIQLDCPACRHQWEAQFDIPRFLWAELHDWAQGLLQSVYRLATAYGWSERDILALSPLRRQLYLGMLNP
ncbi:MAG TPA: phage baseplate protein [Gammaproteobacteria bacterium]|nr:phage baseplate protein [Gammaproteobacteria bacterium]